MNRLLKIARSATPGTGVQFHKEKYGNSGIRSFPGEIIHKDLSVNVCDLTQLPSAEASKKLHQLIDIRNSSRNTGFTTVMA